MAQQDTGLGWSAEGSWLLENPGLICTLSKLDGGNNFPGQPLPESGTEVAQVWSGGLDIGINTNNDRVLKAGRKFNSPPLFVAANLNYSLSSPKLIAVSPVYGTGGIMRLYTSLGSQVSGGAGDIGGVTQHNNGLWYELTAGIGNRAISQWLIPGYYNIDDMMADLTITMQSYYKLNSGFAVACVAHYNGENGTVISPCLISTDFNAVVLSKDGLTQTEFVTYSYVWQGRTYYMSLIPSSTADSISSAGVEIADLRNFPFLYPEGVFNAIAASDRAYISTTAATDPYNQPSSEPGGGDGSPDSETDVDFPLPPSIGAVSSGFLTLFLPSLSQLNSLADYMWSTSFDLDAVRKLFANPMDAILGCYILPISPAVTGSKSVKVAGIAIPGYTWNYTAQEYITLTCGSVTIPKVTGSYLDYEPTTKMQIFLPFIGFREISADDCMGKTLTLQYNIHVLSGACVASLKCGNTVLYTWAGQCSMQIPVTGADLSSAISAAIGIAASAVSVAASGGATAPMIAGAVASTTVNSLNLKPRIERGGSVSGASGFLASQLPYIVRSNPVPAIPAEQNKYIGYPSYITVTLSSLAGYNEIDSIHLEGIPATDAELSEIENLLQNGVIF